MRFKFNKMYTIILILLLLLAVTFSSCGKAKSQLLNQTSSNSSTTLPSPKISKQSTDNENDINNKFANRISTSKGITASDSWINVTNPSPSAKDVDDSSNISINFKYDMDESTLNKNNVIIYEGKHSRIISDLFDYKYDKNTRVLYVKFKENGNSYGSQNGIIILICGEIKNISNESMKINVKFGFSTK